jgi:hypothetical protein
MRAVPGTVLSEAVLQVPQIRPHRNPVQGDNRMWLLCARTQLPQLHIEAGPEHAKERCDLLRRTRDVELPVLYQEGREDKGKVCIRCTIMLSPSRPTGPVDASRR